MNQLEIVQCLKRELLGVSGPDGLQMRETHTAFVFLAGPFAYKLKKNIRLPYLDFSTLDMRKGVLGEELRINQALAHGVYRRIVPVTLEADGSVALDGWGKPLEWLLEMRRLPERDMLDQRMKNEGATSAEIVALGDLFCDFYARTPSQRDGATLYYRHLKREAQINRDHLLAMRACLPRHVLPHELDYSIALIERHAQELQERGRRRLIIDGHGDLRPEHICMILPPVVFDRLEFDATMRQVDIYDEVNYLSLETEIAGQDWIGRELKAQIDRRFRDPPSDGLLQTYGLFRLYSRARLLIDHLIEPVPRTPAKWVQTAQIYLTKASQLAAAALEC